jgi:hypothetical protein
MSVTSTFHTDSALLVPIANSDVDHFSDGSNDPQDFLFYYGSTVITKKFEDKTNPGIDDLFVSIINATDLWAPSTVKEVTNTARTTAKNGYRYKVSSISGGAATGASEPAWPITIGQTVVDNEVTWTNDGKLHESIEIKIASTSLGLDSATPGAPLSLGTGFNGGAANAKQVFARFDDATEVNSQLTELGMTVLNVSESPI